MIARLRKGAVINVFLLAGIGLLVYYATTLTERGQTERSPSSSSADGAWSFPRSVNVATLTEREATVTAVQTSGPGSPARVVSRSLNVATLTEGGSHRPVPNTTRPGSYGLGSPSVNVAYHRRYPVNWRRRYRLEHAHVQRLLRELQVRYTQSLRKREAEGVDAPSRSLSDWRARQIAAAETIGREADAAGTDPWPQCPDPYDHMGASWDDTVRCENGGSWLDSPGMYRCGLQFDPLWERRFGALCP